MKIKYLLALLAVLTTVALLVMQPWKKDSNEKDQIESAEVGESTIANQPADTEQVAPQSAADERTILGRDLSILTERHEVALEQARLEWRDALQASEKKIKEWEKAPDLRTYRDEIRAEREKMDDIHQEYDRRTRALETAYFEARDKLQDRIKTLAEEQEPR